MSALTKNAISVTVRDSAVIRVKLPIFLKIRHLLTSSYLCRYIYFMNLACYCGLNMILCFSYHILNLDG